MYCGIKKEKIISITPKTMGKMKNTKKRTIKYGYVMIFVIATILSTLLTCEKVPDYCGKKVAYDPNCQFCFAGQAYNLCGGRDYNPLTEGCDPTANAVGTRCRDESIVPKGTPCGGYTLTIAAAPADAGSVTNHTIADAYNAGDEVTIEAAATDTEYEFAGWAGALTSGGNVATYTISGSRPQITIVAIFKPKNAGKLITEAFPNGAGEVTRDKYNEIYASGENVTVTATANPGYVFDGWSGANTSKDNPVTITMNESKTLVAIFTPMVYSFTATVNPPDAGTVFVNNKALSGRDSLYELTEIVLLAQPADGYIFDRWSGVDGSAGNPTLFSITGGGMTVTAHFKHGNGGQVTMPTHTLTANVSPAGSGTAVRNPDQKNYEFGTKVTVTATPNNGYSFTGWSKASTSTNTSVTITMDRDKELTANFWHDDSSGIPPPITQQKYIVQESWSGSISLSPADIGSYAAGDTVNIKAVMINYYGHKFKNWTSPSNGVNFADATNPITTFIMPPNAVLVTVNTEVDAPPPVYTYEFRDNRDGKTYLAVEIGGLAWMTENLNYKTANGNDWCYDNEPSNCAIYGRLYDWATAMNINISYNSKELNVSDVKYQGVCPDGWHLPSRQEWIDLVISAGESNAATKLKATSGWFENGTDDYGFSALPGGERLSYEIQSSYFSAVGYYGYATWWTATEYDDSIAYYRLIDYSNSGVVFEGYQNGKSFGRSVRCVGGKGTLAPYILTTTVSPSGGGTVSVSPNQEKYTAGANVTVTANPAKGYIFTNWTGDVLSTKNTIDITLDNDKMLTANFTVTPPPIMNNDGTFTYAGQTYKTLMVGDKRWMAENLNYDIGYSFCYDDDKSYCEKYGRLYSWDDAITACPKGWHLASRDEWDQLAEYVGGDTVPCSPSCHAWSNVDLKSEIGWKEYEGIENKNEIGFSALPGGQCYCPFCQTAYQCSGIDEIGGWWTATAYDDNNAYNKVMNFNGNLMLEYRSDKGLSSSVRCIQDK